MLFLNEDAADRVGIKPILNPIFFDLYKTGLKSLWFVEDISLAEDVRQWHTPGLISEPLKHFIKRILAFFHGADKMVAENISINFVSEVPILEAQFFYRLQAANEDIHSETYSTLVDAFITDPIEKASIFNAVNDMDVIKAKTDWVKKYSDSSKASLPTRLVAMAVVEGVFFSGSFCAIFYIRDLGLMPGLCHSNDYISRDEGQHCQAACMVLDRLLPNERLPVESVHAIFAEAVEIECKFITEAIPVSMIGMNSELMIQYVRFIADYWLAYMKYPALYNARNPFVFMNTIAIQRKNNFFERKVSEYVRANVGAPEKARAFGIDEEF